MKADINKDKDWITFIPETQLDFFKLGRISMKVGHYHEITSNTDNREHKLKTFRVEVNELASRLALKS